MIPSCPPEIKEMMTSPVKWERFNGFDGHAEPSYRAPQTLYCFRESHGLMQGGLTVHRKIEETTVEPDWDLFFDGDSVSVEDFSLYDRFTILDDVGDDGYMKQPEAINTIVGPPFDNKHPWLVVVVI